jgi:hypothetical protein
MRKFYIIISAIFLTTGIWAQSPQKMSYQAVIRDASDQLVTTQVGMQISILQGSESGTPVYIETQTPTPNINGLVTIEIGEGTVVSGDFTTIDWSGGPYFIKTETDPEGSTSYTITGTSELLSVPYALHAKIAESLTGTITETDPVFEASDASDIVDADIANWNTAYGWDNHSLAGYESAFSKNTAFNKSFGTTTGTVVQGNDSRIINGQTAYGWGDHGSAGYESAFSKNTAFNKNFGTSAGTVTQGNDSRIIDGQTAYGWGDHSNVGYLTSENELPSETGNSGKFLMTSGTAVSWETVSSGASQLSELSDVNTSTVTSGNILIANGTDFRSTTIAGDATLASDGALQIADNSVDGTDIALGSDAAGDVMYYDGSNWIRLQKGSDDQVLTLSSGVPSWEDAPGGSGSSTNTVVKTTNYTMSASDNVGVSTAATTITFTLPSAASAGSGRVLFFYARASTLTVSVFSGDSIYNIANGSEVTTLTDWTIFLASDGVNSWYQVK